MKKLAAAVLALAAAACGGSDTKEQGSPPPYATAPPAGSYRLDKTHASLVFKVDHIGFSNYVARFTDLDATLEFDPAKPEGMHIEATIDPGSLALDNAPPGFRDMLLGPRWLDAKAHPKWSFRSTAVRPTGADTAEVDGEFTLRGVTKPVTLSARYNGGYAGFPPYDPQARIGFSVHGALSRSAFGVSEGLPPPGSKMGVGDEVSFAVEAELLGPPTAK